MAATLYTENWLQCNKSQISHHTYCCSHLFWFHFIKIHFNLNSLLWFSQFGCYIVWMILAYTWKVCWQQFHAKRMVAKHSIVCLSIHRVYYFYDFIIHTTVCGILHKPKLKMHRTFQRFFFWKLTHLQKFVL